MSSYDQIIYDVAKRNGYPDASARLIVAQARFESSDYSSNVFKNNFNTSGMKFVGQPLATRGTLAPSNERSSKCNAQSGWVCKNNDYYAKFKSVEDSAKDKIERLFNITRNGITPQDIKNAKTPTEFSTLQKKRNYFGFGTWDSAEGQTQIRNYAAGLTRKLNKIQIVQYIKENPKKSGFVAIVVVGLVVYGIYTYKKLKK
jgi:hypothetical protein